VLAFKIVIEFEFKGRKLKGGRLKGGGLKGGRV
jgi:hypothetical protein